MNRAIAGTHASLGLIGPSVGNTCEYHAACTEWDMQDWTDHLAASHKNCSYGGWTSNRLRHEALAFIDECVGIEDDGVDAYDEFELAVSK